MQVVIFATIDSAFLTPVRMTRRPVISRQKSKHWNDGKIQASISHVTCFSATSNWRWVMPLFQVKPAHTCPMSCCYYHWPSKYVNMARKKNWFLLNIKIAHKKKLIKRELLRIIKLNEYIHFSNSIVVTASGSYIFKCQTWVPIQQRHRLFPRARCLINATCFVLIGSEKGTPDWCYKQPALGKILVQ